MFTSMIPLHIGAAPAFWPGPLVPILLIIALIILVRRGRLGPVTWTSCRAKTNQAPGERFFGPVPPPTMSTTPEDQALATLAERLANGEITPEEYLERTDVLRAARPQQP